MRCWRGIGNGRHYLRLDRDASLAIVSPKNRVTIIEMPPTAFAASCDVGATNVETSASGRFIRKETSMTTTDNARVERSTRFVRRRLSSV